VMRLHHSEQVLRGSDCWRSASSGWELWSRYAAWYCRGQLAVFPVPCLIAKGWIFGHRRHLLACRLCNLALALDGADSASCPPATEGTSNSAASAASCLLSQLTASNQLVMVVSSAVLQWLLGAAWQTPGIAALHSSRSERGSDEALRFIAFASAFRPSPELVRLQLIEELLNIVLDTFLMEVLRHSLYALPRHSVQLSPSSTCCQTKPLSIVVLLWLCCLRSAGACARPPETLPSPRSAAGQPVHQCGLQRCGVERCVPGGVVLIGITLWQSAG
jgi:hypothetical protein